MTATHSEALAFNLSLTSPAYDRAKRRFWRHPRLAELFPHYLLRLHGMVRASIPLMETAVAEARRLAPTDPVAGALVDYFAEHIDEEMNHDVWLLEDLDSIGIPTERVLGQIPSPLVASVVGMQYYYARHQHPVALLAYQALLEGNPPTNAHLDEVRVRTGLPASAFRTLELHGDRDIEHRAELFALIDRLPLTPEQQALIGVNASWTQHLLSESLTEMIELFEAEADPGP